MTSSAVSESACPGCGIVLPEYDGPVHDYIGASAACWHVYGQVLAKDYGEFGMPEEHKFIVDAYAVQHPGENVPRARQSVGVHLIRLCLMLERDMPQRYATALMERSTHGGLHIPWFEPSTPIGTMTAQDVLAGETREEHIELARRWAENVWVAWSAQHETVRRWCDALQAQLPDNQ